jgi:hypothetical protein
MWPATWGLLPDVTWSSTTFRFSLDQSKGRPPVAYAMNEGSVIPWPHPATRIENMILYKYTRLRHLPSILRDGTFAFPLVSQLNDPCESSIESALDYLKRFHQLPLFAYRPVVRYKVGLMSDVGINPLYDESLPKIRENEKIRQQNERLSQLMRSLKGFRDGVGVLSMTDNPKNTVMWAHYADNSRGACVGVDFDHDFFKCYVPNGAQYGAFLNLFHPEKISYQSERPQYRPESDASAYIRSAFFTKFSDWSYEREFRLLRPICDCTIEAKSNIALYRVPQESIVEVVLGLGTKYQDFEKYVLEPAKDPWFNLAKVESPEGKYSLRLRDMRRDGSLADYQGARV